MIATPKPGQNVRLLYRLGRRLSPHDQAVGVVEVIGRGKPRNHGVRIAGRLVVVPSGHLFPAPPNPTASIEPGPNPS